MFRINKTLSARISFITFLAVALLLIPAAPASLDAVPDPARNGAWAPTHGARHLTAVISTPLVAHGIELGTAVVYDDSSTARPEDYIEIYNCGGELMAVIWFDRFGIQRLAIDRAFAVGKDQIEGVLIAVVNGDYV